MMGRIFEMMETIFERGIIVLCAQLVALGVLIWAAFQVSEEDLPIIIVALIIITPLVIGELIFIIREEIA